MPPKVEIRKQVPPALANEPQVAKDPPELIIALDKTVKIILGINNKMLLKIPALVYIQIGKGIASQFKSDKPWSNKP